MAKRTAKKPAKRKSTRKASPRKSSRKAKPEVTETREDLHTRITNTLVSQIEAGNIPWLCPWDKKAARTFGRGQMPYNATSGRQYSGVNVLILWGTALERGYKSSAWCTFKQAKDAGGSVRKGEKATLVVFNKKLDVKERDKTTGDEKTKTVWLLRSFLVFNIDQIEGGNWKDRDNSPAAGLADSDLADWINNLDCKLQHGGDAAFYAPGPDFVQMPDARSFVDNAAYVAVLAHELTHWTGHKSRLNRDHNGGKGSQAYAFEELIAELGAAFTCAEIGQPLAELRHASYLQSWLKVLKDDKKAIFKAAAHATKAARLLVDKYPKAEIPADDLEAVAA